MESANDDLLPSHAAIAELVLRRLYESPAGELEPTGDWWMSELGGGDRTLGRVGETLAGLCRRGMIVVVPASVPGLVPLHASDPSCNYKSAASEQVRLCLTPAAYDRMDQLLDVEVSVDEIDQFHAARKVLPPVPARSEFEEDQVQKWFEDIIGEPLHQKDWGGETCDLYTSRVRIGNKRVRAAFILKGRGTTGPMTLGRRGDQLLRLFRLDVELYVVQYVGAISEAVVEDARGKVRVARAQVCIIDGADTYRILNGAGKIS